MELAVLGLCSRFMQNLEYLHREIPHHFVMAEKL